MTTQLKVSCYQTNLTLINQKMTQMRIQLPQRNTQMEVGCSRSDKR